MSSIMPHYRTISELLRSRSFAIDEYQREYKWECRNIQELLSDLLGKFETSYRDGDSPKNVSDYADYFLGSIIVSQRGNKNYLVDGQQRVTSVTLLLIYLYRESKARDLSAATALEPLIFSDNFGELSFNLDITERVPVIRALFTGEHYNGDGKEESIRTILDRYRDIEDFQLAGELGEGLAPFVYWLIHKVGIIEIATVTDAHAYSIFETMNDRGRPLSPVDMLKAYLLAPIDSDDGRANANRAWKSTVLALTSWPADPDPERDAACIKAWLRAQYADSIRDRKKGATDKDWELIGSTFHRWIRDNEKRVGAGTAAANLRIMTDEFPFFARAYRQILDAGRAYTPGLESVYYNAHNDFTWQSTVLLAPLTIDDDADTVRRKIEATAAYLDIWLMRRVVNYIRVGYSNVSYPMWALCKDIRRKPLDELITILTGKLHADDTTFEQSPSRGREGIYALRLNQFSRRYIYHLLARITAAVDVGAGKADQFDHYVDRTQKNPFDIEHIWPDKYNRYRDQFESRQEFEAWRDSICALLLLPADVNRSYQDQPFEVKAPHYAKQNFYAASLTRSAYQHQPQFEQYRICEKLPFKPYKSFGRAEQEERNDLVLALANKIWSPSRLEDLRR
ncbi:GmrSD restriction endonuclease domain-containing protein [Nocardia gipuzkoensis]